MPGLSEHGVFDALAPRPFNCHCFTYNRSHFSKQSRNYREQSLRKKTVLLHQQDESGIRYKIINEDLEQLV